eukprot:scaffold5308_cov70-Phaeocystis_antarctica.AAC.11
MSTCSPGSTCPAGSRSTASRIALRTTTTTTNQHGVWPGASDRRCAWPWSQVRIRRDRLRRKPCRARDHSDPCWRRASASLRGATCSSGEKHRTHACYLTEKTSRRVGFLRSASAAFPISCRR